MSCPTCGHTLQAIGDGMRHCPRCGTLTLDTEAYVPALVDRCRRFENHFRADEDALLMQAWRVLGVEESIARPQEREPSCRPS